MRIAHNRAEAPFFRRPSIAEYPKARHHRATSSTRVEREERPMTNSRRLNMIRLVAVTMSVVALAPISGAQERPPIVQQLAKTYGLDSWNQVEKLRYTFNIESASVKIARSWEWDPSTDL